MDSINDIISNLTDDDINTLKGMAAEMFGSQSEAGKKSKPQENGMPDISSILGNAEMLKKLTEIMNAMQKEDDRVRFIGALKPLLSEGRQKRADDAVKLMKILDILPVINR